MRKAPLFFILFVLTGCNFKHRYCSHPLPLNCTDLSKQTARAYAHPQFIPEELPPQPWWQLFQDPHLDTLMQMAIANHPDMKQAFATVRLACQRAKEKRSHLFPHVDFNPSLLQQKVSDTSPFFLKPFAYYTLTNLEIDFTYQLDLWGKNRFQFLAELDEARAVWAEARQAELILTTALAQNYFSLQGNLLRAAIAENRRQALYKSLDINKLQFSRGIAPSFQLSEIELELAQVSDFLLYLEGEIEYAKHAVIALSGNPACIEIEPLLECPQATLERPFPLPPTLPLDLLSRRPEITAKKWRIEKGCQLVKAAQAAFYPSIDLFANPAFLTTEIGKLLTWGSFNAAIGAAAHLPLFDAGKLRAELGEKQEELEIAIEEYNRSILHAVQEVSDGITALRVAEDRLVETGKAVAAADALYRLYLDTYEQGVSTYLPVLAAAERLYLEQDLQAVVQLAKLQSAVMLMKALGGGYSECP